MTTYGDIRHDLLEYPSITISDFMSDLSEEDIDARFKSIYDSYAEILRNQGFGTLERLERKINALAKKARKEAIETQETENDLFTQYGHRCKWREDIPEEEREKWDVKSDAILEQINEEATRRHRLAHSAQLLWFRLDVIGAVIWRFVVFGEDAPFSGGDIPRRNDTLKEIEDHIREILSNGVQVTSMEHLYAEVDKRRPAVKKEDSRATSRYIHNNFQDRLGREKPTSADEWRKHLKM